MAAGIRTYRDLLVWQKAMDLASQALDLAETLRHPRYFAVADQLRRAAVSIPTNIAEGHGRRSRGEYVRFLAIANGSARELETLLLLLVRRDAASRDAADTALGLADEVCRMLSSLHYRLRGHPGR